MALKLRKVRVQEVLTRKSTQCKHRLTLVTVLASVMEFADANP